VIAVAANDRKLAARLHGGHVGERVPVRVHTVSSR
jgi:hypothetical protein